VLPIATRAGVVSVDVRAAGDVTVDMGTPQVLQQAAARLRGRTFDGLHVSIGNPHLVCVIDAELDSLDLSAPVDVDAAVFPGGVNVEFVRLVDETHAVMRVRERGAGETESCGSGACAVAAALSVRQDVGAGAWTLDVPGGRLEVRIDAANGHALLTGPAVLVAEGRWWGDEERR
jgi:diaminopimelate epimerase